MVLIKKRLKIKILVRLAIKRNTTGRTNWGFTLFYTQNNFPKQIFVWHISILNFFTTLALLKSTKTKTICQKVKSQRLNSIGLAWFFLQSINKTAVHFHQKEDQQGLYSNLIWSPFLASFSFVFNFKTVWNHMCGGRRILTKKSRIYKTICVDGSVSGHWDLCNTSCGYLRWLASVNLHELTP